MNVSLSSNQYHLQVSKWIDHRGLGSLFSVIVSVRIHLKKIVVGGIDSRFGNVSVSHVYSQVTLKKPSAQVVETLVTVLKIDLWDNSHPDNHR